MVGFLELLTVFRLLAGVGGPLQKHHSVDREFGQSVLEEFEQRVDRVTKRRRLS